MTRRTLNLLPILLLALCLSGCARSPMTQWALAREGLTTAQNVLSDARQQGLISPKDYHDIRVNVELPAREALEALHDLALTLPKDPPPDDKAKWQQRLDAFNLILTRLEAYAVKYKGQPTTKRSG